VRRRRLIIPASVLAAVLLAGCGGDDGGGLTASNTPKELTGDWSGELTQEGLPPFRVAVRFDSGGPLPLIGKVTIVAYTEIECGGIWTWESTLDSNPPYHFFKEEIDQGAGGECKGSGEVEIRPEEPCINPAANECGYRHLRYEFQSGGVTSKGVLTPAGPGELNRVFEEAGVDLEG
jgi:hypothetical protein